MSTTTTRRASSFSASRCAAVAPTFPAPTTVILFTIPVFLLIGAGNLSGSHSQSYRPAPVSAANLRERVQSADFHLKKIVLERLLIERRQKVRRDWLATSEWIPQAYRVLPEET